MSATDGAPPSPTGERSGNPPAARRRWRPRIWTVLLAVNLALLLLPLAGIWFLRLYESALIRQTESELLAQGAVLAASFRVDWLDGANDADHATLPVRRFPAPPQEGPWRPLQATLDLAEDSVADEVSPARATDRSAAARAATVGRSMERVIRDAQRQTLAAIRLLDHAGIVVASTTGDGGQAFVGLGEVDRALAGEAVAQLRRRTLGPDQPAGGGVSRAATLRVHVALPVEIEDRIAGVVLLSRTPRTIDQALAGKWPHLLAMAAALAAVALGLALFVALTIVRPIRQIVVQARDAAAGTRDAPMPLSRRYTREVAELSESLATMTRTLERRAGYIRDFTAEVGHEFKTPLASMKGTLELLRDDLDAMSTGDRQRFLGNLGEDVERLERLTKRLLDLARADAARPEHDAACDPLEVSETLAARYRDLGLRIQIAAPARTIRAAIDVESLAAAMGNLLDNVLQHAGRATTVYIAWRAAEGRVVGTIEDDGPGISAGNRAKVFDRFFTTRRDAGGTGLGLPIVRGRLAAYGGDIRLVDGEHGASFEIVLRAAT